MFSVIIPSYNAEETLPQCLESLKLQSFCNFEAIIIIDGSTDNSEQICRAIIGSDIRFKVVRIKHSGVSDARQLGLNLSTKEWVLFLDADDTLEKNAMQNLYDHIISYPKSEIVIGDYNVVVNGNRYKSTAPFALSTNYIREFLSFGKIPTTLWGKAIRRQIIYLNNISFSKGTGICEDYQFLSKLLLKSHSISYMPCAIYNWTAASPNGLSRVNFNDFYTKSTVLQDVMSFYKKNEGGLYVNSINKAYYITYMMYLGVQDKAPYFLSKPIFSVKDIQYRGLSLWGKLTLLILKSGATSLAVKMFNIGH